MRSATAIDPWMRVVQDGQDSRETILENLRAQPRAWLTHRVEVQPDRDARLSRLNATSFDYAGTVMLNAALADGANLPAAAPTDDKVTITSYAAEQVQIS